MLTPEILVQREVIYCISSLMDFLMRQDTPEAYELLESIPFDDWNSAAYDYIMNLEGEELKEIAGSYDLPQIERGESEQSIREALNSAASEDYQSFCQDNDIEPYTLEIFEWWIVTDYLASKLENKGEVILDDVHGLTIWGRTCTGQAIYLDSVIEEITNDINNA